MSGQVIALIGLAICTVFCGVGSAIGLWKTGTASSGVLSEDGKKFSKVLILAVLPATQGIYGFVLTILGSAKVVADMSIAAGWSLLFATLPLTIVGCISAVFQGLTAVSCITAVAKDETISGKLLLFPAMVETYAILALVISIILMGAI